ncbi:hypothetical protein L9F63_006215, partial [Diploptera punctata]
GRRIGGMSRTTFSIIQMPRRQFISIWRSFSAPLFKSAMTDRYTHTTWNFCSKFSHILASLSHNK